MQDVLLYIQYDLVSLKVIIMMKFLNEKYSLIIDLKYNYGGLFFCGFW